MSWVDRNSEPDPAAGSHHAVPLASAAGAPNLKRLQAGGPGRALGRASVPKLAGAGARARRRGVTRTVMVIQPGPGSPMHRRRLGLAGGQAWNVHRPGPSTEPASGRPGRLVTRPQLPAASPAGRRGGGAAAPCGAAYKLHAPAVAGGQP